MKLNIYIVILIVIFSSCQKTIKKQFKTKNNIEVKETSKDTIWSKFKYFYKSEDKFITQKLAVNWLSKNEIEFRLLTDNELCLTEYFGKATNKYPEMDLESDEDNEGISYFANQYIKEEKNYLIYLRIAIEKDKALIKFVDKSNVETDCFPESDIKLIKK